MGWRRCCIRRNRMPEYGAEELVYPEKQEAGI